MITMVVAAQVVQIMGTLGVKGVRRVRCKIIEGHDKGKVLTRNVAGPLKQGDIIVLKDTTMDTEGRFQK